VPYDVPILISGRACRLPGSDDYQGFRELLRSGTCAVGEIGEDRWAQWRFYHPVPGTSGKAYTQAAGLLDDIWGFDPKPFNLSPREAEQMDPQQRLLLQVVWEALESADLRPSELAGENVGVYVGASSMDFGTRMMYDQELADLYTMTGSTLSVIANRVSYIFDFKGPSFTVDTACSSSLVALNEAVSALEAGRVEIAIVAGVNILLNPIPFIGFSAGRFLSPTGLCQSFSDHADGYVRSEGVVSLVLRRADSKIGGNSPVYAEILGADINSDGRTSGIALPKGEAQANLLRGLYEKSGIDPDRLSFIEAHGTGTQVGDAAEAMAVGSALARHRSKPLPIGSVKSNIGHLEPVSGLAGILKSLIAFEDRLLPASLHAAEPNRNIDFEDNKLALAAEPVDLGPDSNQLVAGVSSFGFGGTNAHVILASPSRKEGVDSSVQQSGQTDTGEHMLFASAFCADALRETAMACADHLSTENCEPGNYCKALLENRDAHPERVAVLGGDCEELLDGLQGFITGDRMPGVFKARSQLKDEPAVFVYSGNGAQYAGMGCAARAADENYARHFNKVSEHFAALAGWSLTEMLDDPDLEQKITQATIAQPILFADQVALSFSLADRGLLPKAVLGHSGGEIAAAHVCGSLDLDQALRTIVERSNSQEQLAGKGTMAALQAPEDEVRTEIERFPAKQLTIAAVNSPRSVTLVGPAAELEPFLKHARKMKRWAGLKLGVNYPYHSPMQDEIEEMFRKGLKYITPQENSIPYFSCVYGQEVPGSTLDVDYWWSLLREPVRFTEAVKAAHEKGFRLFLECGPQPVLTSYLTDTLADVDDVAKATHTFEKGDSEEHNPVSRSVCRAFVNGAAIDREMWWPGSAASRQNLPTYQWQNEQYRIDVTDTIENSMGINPDAHAALGRKFDWDSNFWLSQIDQKVRPDLAQHVVQGRSLAPGSFFFELAVAAARRVTNSEHVEIRDLDIHAPLVLMEKSTADLRTMVSEDASSIDISSRPVGNRDKWLKHVSARFGILSAGWPENTASPDLQFVDGDHRGERVYKLAERLGLNYGPLFRKLSHLRVSSAQELEVFLDETANDILPGSAFDPLSMDSLFHGLLAGLQEHKSLPQNIAYVPVHVRRIRVRGSETRFSAGRLRITRIGTKSVVADFECFDADGRLSAILEGVRFSTMRLAGHFELEAASYSFETLPVKADRLPGSLEALLDASDAGKSVAEFASTIGDENDVTHLLVEAICQRIAYDTLSGLADREEKLEISSLADCNWPYFDVLLDMLESSELVTRSNEQGTLQLAAEIDLPEAKDQIANLLIERPDGVSECALLARLAAVSGELVKDDAGQVEMFGGELLKAFLASSIAARTRLALVTDWLEQFLEPFPDEVSHSVAIVVPHGGKCRLGNLRRFGQVDIHVVTYEEIGDHDDSHSLIVFPMGLPPKTFSDARMARFADLLQGNGLLVSIESTADSLVSMLSAVGRRGDHSGPDQVIRQRAFGGSEDWQALFGEAGFSEPFVKELDGQHFGYSVLASNKKAGDAPLASQHAVMSEVQPTAFAQNDMVMEQFQLTRMDEVGGIWLFDSIGSVPTDDDPPISIAYMPAISPSQAHLASRIMALSGLLGELKQGSAIWLIIPNGAPAGNDQSVDPYQTAVWAYARTALNEFPELDIHMVDLEETDALAAKGFLDVLKSGSPETELVFRGDQLSAIRIADKMPHGCGDAPRLDPDDYRTSLVLPTGGRLDELHWELVKSPAPEAHQVEVDVIATGLNYRDVMWALGMLPEEALENGFAGPTLGIEYAGRVRRTGDGVTQLKVGDLVAATGPASFTSRQILDEAKACKLPDGIDLLSAATIPVAFFTAYYSANYLARLAEGETILVHGAAGGVGLAAIQVAKALGARIIATAGTPAKRDLLRSLEVDHVLDSRSLEFAGCVRDITSGEGVDVVLNSLAGEAMELGLNVLKPFGRFVELGKQDYYLNSKIGLRPLKENISYFGVDADQVMAARPQLVERLFSEIMENFHQGVFVPLLYRAFDGSQVVDAFRLMQRSAHIGKIVVSPTPFSEKLPQAHASMFTASPKGAHVIAGGLGGIGLEIMTWLAERGARTLILLSRTGTVTEEGSEKIEELLDGGVDVRVVVCDVSDKSAVEATLAGLRKDGGIAGIINAAMVLEDMEIRNLDEASLKRTLDAKVSGSLNLHDATLKDELAYFVMFSSVASMIGNIGQASYVAANGYMEGLARLRRNLNLPALAIGWGAVSDAGYLAREAEKAAIVANFSGNMKFATGDMLHALGELLAKKEIGMVGPVVTVTPMSWSAAAGVLKTVKTPTFGLLSRKAAQNASSGNMGNFRESLQNLPKDKLVPKLAGFIISEIALVLRVSESDLSMNRPISDFGMDSLMGVEFAIGAQKVLGEDIPMTMISVDGMSINDISEKIADHILADSDRRDDSDTVVENLAAQHAGEVVDDHTINKDELLDTLTKREKDLGSVID
jgi:acyl transferase domain-containing protein/NADPH:quinone reductase-like Zn-dependent oxidoreductase/short-subunit dehydrogenase